LLSTYGTNGDITAQSLGGGEDIGLDAQLLMVPEMTRAAYTNLYLVAHQQGTGIIGKLMSNLE
jgi:hypothetical protein